MMDEENFEKIWNKWSDKPMPREASELCRRSSKPVKLHVAKLVQICLNAGILDKQKAEEILEQAVRAMFVSAMGAYYVGLEYASPQSSNATSSSNEEDDTQIRLQMDYYDWGLIDACLRLATMSVNKKKFTGKNLDRTETEMASKIQELQERLQQQAVALTENLSVVELETTLNRISAIQDQLIAVVKGVDAQLAEHILKSSRRS